MKILFAALFLLASTQTMQAAASLVSPETVKLQKEATKRFRLKNRIPVIYRHVPNSDILYVTVGFKSGSKDLPYEKRPIGQMLFSTMALAAKDWDKERIFKFTEKYAVNIGCAGAIEHSSCSVETINDYWKDSLNMLAAVIKNPTITDTDLKIKKDAQLAEIKGQIADPGSYVNSQLNKVYYPKDHPYASSYEDYLKIIPQINRQEVLDWHKKILSSDSLYISIVGSLEPKPVLKYLNELLGDIGKKNLKKAKVTQPKFNKKAAYSFTNRKLPTAYMRIKFNGIPASAQDTVAVRFLMKVLDEELTQEIRTKRSLTYSVYSYMIQLSEGIGVIGVSTSKPEETLKAITHVIKAIKAKNYTRSELDEHKQVYATNYFLTQEAHSSLGNALLSNEMMYGNTDRLYDFPNELSKVTPKDIKRLANSLLRNFRVGVLYERSKFKDKWAAKFIKTSIK